MKKQKVLFVCIHNSARSQMAEEILRQQAKDRFEVESAGISPGKLNPLAVAVLQEIGIDISGKQTQAAADLIRQGKMYDFVITVCDESSAEQCRIFRARQRGCTGVFLTLQPLKEARQNGSPEPVM